MLILPLAVIGCRDMEQAVQAPDEIHQYDTAELKFLSQKTYSAITPWFNPFTDITLSLELTSPSGRKLEVPGFYDGDGRGGLHGRVFKVRICPDETGEWRWTSRSNLAELDRINGVFRVAGTLQGGFSRGAISILKKDPRFFAFTDQTPHFLIGKFLDIDQPPFLQYSHTFFSEQWTEKQRQQLLNHQTATGVNKINVYLANKGDYHGIATTPWLGTADYNVKSRFDLRMWRRFDAWVKEFRDRDLAAHIWFFADDSGFGQLTAEEREQLVSYAMARLSGYVNTLFTLALEWQEGFTESEIREIGTLAQTINPWGRLVSVHGLSVSGVRSDTVFFDEAWLDFIDIQTGFVEHQKIHELGVLYRGYTNKPVILEEFSFGEDNAEQRINTWAAVMTAPAGIGTGSGIKAITAFLQQVDISVFNPAPELVVTDNAYVLSATDGRAIVYIYRSGSVELSPQKSSAMKGRWFDPRTGEFSGPAFKLDGDRIIKLPTEQDWVLLLTP